MLGEREKEDACRWIGGESIAGRGRAGGRRAEEEEEEEEELGRREALEKEASDCRHHTQANMSFSNSKNGR